MDDEIRIYHVDDPNDAPERRLSAFPTTINPFIPTSLPQYVIPPVANSLYTAMQYYWYSAYQQGIAAQKHQQQQQASKQQDLLLQQQQLLHQQQLHHHHHHNHRQHQMETQAASSSTSTSSSSSSSSSSASQLGSSAASPVSSTTPTTTNSEASHHHHNHLHHSDDNTSSNPEQRQNQKHQHIKKPLNPFMIYMQKRRPEIVKQGKFKESALINQELGKEWRALTKEQQEPFYKLAEQEKILHAQKYPGWSARDNYANQKKKKKMKLKSISLNGLDQSDKKCRARFGLNNMASWCKPCRRKKKCIYRVERVTSCPRFW